MVEKREKPSNLPMMDKLLKKNHLYPKRGAVDYHQVLKCSKRLLLLGPIYYLGAFGYIYKTLQIDVLDESVNTAISLVEDIIVFLTLSMLLYNGEEFLNSIERSAQYNYVLCEKSRKICQKIDKFIIWIYYGIKVVCVFLSLYYFEMTHCTPALAENEGYICSNLIQLWYPFKMDFFLAKLMLYFVMLVLKSTYYPFSLLIVLSYYVIPLQLIIFRVENLEKIIKRSIENKEYLHKAKFRKRLSFFNKAYSEILECVRCLNGAVKGHCLASMVYLPLLAGLVIYNIIVNLKLLSLVDLTIYSFPIVLSSLQAEHLLDRGSSLSEAFYDIPWYEMDIELRKSFHIMLGNMQNPLRIKAGSLTTLNNTFILKLLKATYSFLLFLKR